MNRKFSLTFSLLSYFTFSSKVWRSLKPTTHLWVHNSKRSRPFLMFKEFSKRNAKFSWKIRQNDIDRREKRKSCLFDFLILFLLFVFSAWSEATLNVAVSWLFRQCARIETESRRKSIELVSVLVPNLPGLFCSPIQRKTKQETLISLSLQEFGI